MKIIILTTVISIMGTISAMQQPLTPRSQRFQATFNQTTTSIDKILEISKSTLENLSQDKNNNDHQEELSNHVKNLNGKTNDLNDALQQQKSHDHTAAENFITFVQSVLKIAVEIEPIVLDIIRGINESQRQNHPAVQYQASIDRLKESVSK